MFIIKVLSSILIIFSCWFLGNSIANTYLERVQNIRQLQNCLQILESEIIYLSTPLPYALENVFMKGDKRVSYIFKDIKNRLVTNRNSDVLESFNYVLNSDNLGLNLKKDDIQILLNLGRVLGSSDREDQQKYFKSLGVQFSKQEKDAIEEMKKNKDMYKKLGILIGLAIVIILF